MKILLISFFFCFCAFSQSLQVMNFNTMCDFCKGSHYFEYSQRLEKIQHIVETYQPDLISLQELRSGQHVNKIFKNLPHYQTVFSQYLLMDYADPTLAFNKEKFTLLDQGQFWLGPKSGDFSLGWKIALPRQVHWVKLKFKDKVFIFASSHLDNRLENLIGSAKMINAFFSKFQVPILFAADTNMTTDMKEYQVLVEDLFINTFNLKESFKVKGAYQDDKDLCYLRKGKVFPACRVDHILISQPKRWKVKEFSIDTNKYGKTFPSDHRPVILSIELN